MMASDSSLQLANPPIVEALLNIFIAPLAIDDSIAQLLERFAPVVMQRYPRQDKISQVTATLVAGESPSATTAHQTAGLMFRSIDTKDAIQARIDGLGVSRLAPYEGWEPLRANLQEFWQLYANVFPEATPTLLGARYINSIPLPEGATIEEYLTAYPEIPRGLPQEMRNFFYRVNLDLDDKGTLLTMQMAALPQTELGKTNLLFDLDFVFKRDKEMDLWEQIDSMRPVKDYVFMSSITPKLRELLDATA